MPENFEVVDDYLISYDGDYFDLHKPSDVRSLVNVANYVVKENEQLQKRIQELEIGENEIILKQETTINQLIKENEQLKKENTFLKKAIKDHLDYNQILDEIGLISDD